MASVQVLKRRIRSVKNTKQITKAMQLVAASKMLRTQDASKASSSFASMSRELLAALGRHASVREHPLFVEREQKGRLIIAISSDKGLAGAYNNNIYKAYSALLSADEENGIKDHTITIGRKVAMFASRIRGNSVLGFYEDLPDAPHERTFRAIMETAVEKFLNGEVDAVDVIYTEFISSVKQEVRTRRILPVGFDELVQSGLEADAKFEPSVEKVLDKVVYRLVESQLLQAFLDAKASEYVMRMFAMKNATDNASDLIDDLTLVMNKARQAAITQEIAEISGGAVATNG